MSALLQASIASTAGSTWLQPMRHWPRTALAMLRSEPAVVRVLVASLRGSAPREPGACMLVSPDGIRGSIGGGHLEWQAIAAARELLPDAAPPARLQRFVLGRELGQCCGGVVELWIERFAAADIPLLEKLAKAPASLVTQLKGGELSRAVVGWGERSETQQSSAPMLGFASAHPNLPLKSQRELRRLVPSPAGGRGWSEGPGEGLSPESTTAVSGGLPSPGATRHPLPPAGEGSKVRLVCDESCITLTELIADLHPPVWLYGAGHVGQAIAKLLMDLPLSLSWIDSRADAFPADLPDDIDHRVVADPAASVASAPAGTRFLVLTHDHAQDYALCRAILARNDFAFAGLIGSASKAARFRSRLAREDGFDAARIARLVCPIGVAGIASKWPAAIAVGVVAQLLQLVAWGERSEPQHSSAPMLGFASAHPNLRGGGITPEPPAAACSPEGCASCKPQL
ncbi:MAG: Molybdenum cofactor sulfurylase [Hydrocarboniphaga sp.]|uniref:xanthine dehydrogenase accessory protein XdhC n=1 Tax=Hydrocarboniphaga sp. TaxID=2033016 RepID=UPI00260E09BB|nr:xanthine dehydrogenase accessory protein XdhC [Hydrocarboniphaga sp.]MDB5971745.1 Molybdenum cofactor sulfurylase [Hydrocarboniphaga sp.]